MVHKGCCGGDGGTDGMGHEKSEGCGSGERGRRPSWRGLRDCKLSRGGGEKSKFGGGVRIDQRASQDWIKKLFT